MRGQAGLSLVASAGSLAEADALIAAAPDVALVDLGLPDGSGIEFIARLQRATRAKSIVITIFRDRDSVLRSLEAGADGYLLKDAGPGQIAAAIHAALDGGAPISPEAARHLLQRFETMRAARPQGAEAKTLTPREEKVIKMRFGVGDGSEHTLEEVGQNFAVTRERIRQIEAKALRKLRHPSRSRKLKAFLEGRT